MSRQLIKAIFILVTIITVKSEVVCSEDELVREIIEDLEDNGIFHNLSLRKTRLFKRIPS